MVRRRTPIVQVAGDPTADWMLVSSTGAAGLGVKKSFFFEKGTSASIHAQPGGAALLSDLLAAALDSAGERGAPVKLGGIALSPEVLTDPRNSSIARTFTTWEPFPAGPGNAEERNSRCSLPGMRQMQHYVSAVALGMVLGRPHGCHSRSRDRG